MPWKLHPYKFLQAEGTNRFAQKINLILVYYLVTGIFPLGRIHPGCFPPDHSLRTKLGFAKYAVDANLLPLESSRERSELQNEKKHPVFWGGTYRGGTFLGGVYLEPIILFHASQEEISVGVRTVGGSGTLNSTPRRFPSYLLLTLLFYFLFNFPSAPYRIFLVSSPTSLQFLYCHQKTTCLNRKLLFPPPTPSFLSYPTPFPTFPPLPQNSRDFITRF